MLSKSFHKEKVWLGMKQRTSSSSNSFQDKIRHDVFKSIELVGMYIIKSEIDHLQSPKKLGAIYNFINSLGRKFC